MVYDLQTPTPPRATLPPRHATPTAPTTVTPRTRAPTDLVRTTPTSRQPPDQRDSATSPASVRARAPPAAPCSTTPTSKPPMPPRRTTMIFATCPGVHLVWLGSAAVVLVRRWCSGCGAGARRCQARHSAPSRARHKRPAARSVHRRARRVVRCSEEQEAEAGPTAAHIATDDKALLGALSAAASMPSAPAGGEPTAPAYGLAAPAGGSSSGAVVLPPTAPVLEADAEGFELPPGRSAGRKPVVVRARRSRRRCPHRACYLLRRLRFKRPSLHSTSRTDPPLHLGRSCRPHRRPHALEPVRTAGEGMSARKSDGKRGPRRSSWRSSLRRIRMYAL